MHQTLQKILFAFLIVSISGPAFAGGKDGGGGFGVICPSGVPYKRPVLLDLHEYWDKQTEQVEIDDFEPTGDEERDAESLREMLVRILKPSRHNVALFRVLSKMSATVLEKFEEAASTAEQKTKKYESYLFTQVDVGRSRPVSIPKGCHPQVIAYMDGEEHMLFDKSLWLQMSIANRAALVIHEALYWSRRLLFEDEDSSITREHTAAIVISALRKAPRNFGISESMNAQLAWDDYNKILVSFWGPSIVEMKLTQGSFATVEWQVGGKTAFRKKLTEKNPTFISKPLKSKPFDYPDYRLKLTGDPECKVEVTLKADQAELKFYDKKFFGLSEVLSVIELDCLQLESRKYHYLPGIPSDGLRIRNYRW